VTELDLASFDTLSFDCYGTLIDWEAGIVAALAPLLKHNGRRVEPAELLHAFAAHESATEAANPSLKYSRLLRLVHRAVAEELGMDSSDELDRAFGDSVQDWPAFQDSAEALAGLGLRYRLVILSNVDRESFAGSARHLGVAFDAVYTAEDIGSYKPDRANFRYLLAHERGRLLHVAQSLYHDHAPAKAAGMDTVWIDRRGRDGGATPQSPATTYDMRCESLREFADLAGAPAER